MFSGDTEAFSSDPSVEAAGRGRNCASAASFSISSTWLRTCETMAGLGPALRRSGLVIGELLIAALFLVLVATLGFLVFLGRSTAEVTGAGIDSRSISAGELFDWVLWSYNDDESFCA